MIDTHTHLYLPEFSVENQIEEVGEGQCAAVDRALAAGVKKMILPNVDRGSISQMHALHALRPDCTYMAMGLHPTEVKENYVEDLDYIMNLLVSGRDNYVAVGEVGMDLYWDKSFEKEQMIVFDRQLSVASELDLPVIIHCREALDQTLEVLQSHTDLKVVFHSFGGDSADVERIRVRHDAFFGINGIVTFKNSTLSSTLPSIGLDRILTETDSPYLAPVPFRGKRNESAYIPKIVEKIADSMGVDAAFVAEKTVLNACKFFNI